MTQWSGYTSEWLLQHQLKQRPVEPVQEVKEPSHKASKQLEKDLQRKCEKWLRQRGYLMLSGDNMLWFKRPDLIPTPKGFFGHWFESERNAFMPDLLVIDYPLRRPPLFVELKVRNKWQRGQKEMIAARVWQPACWTLEEFISTVEKWEAK